jgi:hypothetical protein
MQAGQKLTKSDGYRALSEWMNKKLKDPTKVWSAKEGKSRWEACMTKYKNVHSLMTSQTGFAITAQDEKEGIETLTDKQNALCPAYRRLDAWGKPEHSACRYC